MVLAQAKGGIHRMIAHFIGCGTLIACGTLETHSEIAVRLVWPLFCSVLFCSGLNSQGLIKISARQFKICARQYWQRRSRSKRGRIYCQAVSGMATWVK
jgi:hypothetical protein